MRRFAYVLALLIVQAWQVPESAAQSALKYPDGYRIARLSISTRTRNGLFYEKIETVGELAAAMEAKGYYFILNTPGLGAKALEEIKSVLGISPQSIISLADAPSQPDETKIYMINFSVRVNRALVKARLRTLGQLRSAYATRGTKLYDLPDLGTKAVSEIKQALGLDQIDQTLPTEETPLEYLPLPPRTKRGLARRVQTLGDLRRLMKQFPQLEIYGLGKTSMDEIQALLERTSPKCEQLFKSVT